MESTAKEHQVLAFYAEVEPYRGVVVGLAARTHGAHGMKEKKGPLSSRDLRLEVIR